MIRVRPAIGLDAGPMAALLNRLIEAGGTTALTRPVTADDLSDRMRAAPQASAWHVALDAVETVVGFQYIVPNPKLPPGAVDIVTFVRSGQTGLGIGSALFDATRAAAAAMGYLWINATIRTDNEGGLIYYQSRGFRDWAFEDRVRLDNGLVVDKVSKRFDL